MAKNDEALEMLKTLLELHDIEQRIGGVGKDTKYDEVRKLRRESGKAWDAARVLVYGPPEVDAKPRNPAEAARWAARAKAAAESRNEKVA